MILLLAALAAAEPPVVVSSLTTQQLAAQCRGDDAETAATFCTGYILGVFDTLSRAHAICPSANRASTAEVVAVARKALRGKKKSASAPAFVVSDAFRAAFGCKRR